MLNKWGIVVIVLGMVILSCNFVTEALPGSPTEAEPELVTEIVMPTPTVVLPADTATLPPTIELPPTQEMNQSPEPTRRPTRGVAETETSMYYTDEFDSETVNWLLYWFGRKEEDYDYSAGGGSLNIEIKKPRTYLYFISKGSQRDFTYQDVRLEINFTNQGANRNLVGLVCRVTPDGEDYRWYEVNVNSDGLWSLYYYNGKDWNLLYNGGSTAIHMGKEENQYVLTCVGNKLTLSINDREVKSVTDSNLSEGGVGFTVSTLEDVYPVKVRIESVTVAEP